MPRGRKQTLFTEYLEHVSGKLLEDQYRAVIAKLIKGHAGIYALYKGERLYYIGLASNLMRRVRHHLKDRHAKRWDRFSVYLAVRNEHIKPLESLLLRIALPTGNRVKGRLPNAVDLRRVLHRAMRERDATYYATLLGGSVARRQVRNATSKARGTRVLDGRLDQRKRLRGRRNGEEYMATLRKDGYISCGGKRYSSPSAAAYAVVRGGVNGWRFWHYRVPGKGWVPLSNMRK
jgi:Restriction Enzyme Adenine Methylase Associated